MMFDREIGRVLAMVEECPQVLLFAVVLLIFEVVLIVGLQGPCTLAGVIRKKRAQGREADSSAREV